MPFATFLKIDTLCSILIPDIDQMINMISIGSDFVKEQAYFSFVALSDRHAQSQGDSSGLSQLF